jgi:histidine ammonia-lyase
MEKIIIHLLSGGNFHAQSLTLRDDFLVITLATDGGISQRMSELMPGGHWKLPATLADNPVHFKQGVAFIFVQEVEKP